jgi:hypothetical protein
MMGATAHPTEMMAEDGIQRADLEQITGLKRDCLKSHIWQINAAIEDSGYRNEGYEVARLVRTRETAA